MTRVLQRLWAVVALLAVAATIAACGGSDGSSGGGTGASAGSEDVELGAWGGLANPGGEPVRGGTLRLDQSGAPPAVSSLAFLSEPDNGTMQVVMQVFDQLVEFLPGELDPQPGLAERWTVSDDGLSYTFKLRDAQFSDGTPVTSADAKWVLDRARGPESFFGSLFGAITSVQTPDDSTVVLKLSKPTPALLHSLATAGASIVPSKLVKRIGVEAFNKAPIGSGPFTLPRWQPDQPIELKRNPRYWRAGQPYLDEVVLAPTPNDNTRVLNVRSGTSDVADYVPFAQIEPIDKSGEAKVLVAPGADMSVVFINNNKKPFDELAVRQALNYATPVDSIIDVVFHGAAPAMNTVLPKLKYWTDKAKAYTYDVDKAKELLADSSVPNGFDATISIDGSDSATKQVAQILKQAWQEIGVDLTIQPRELAVLGEDWPAGKTS